MKTNVLKIGKALGASLFVLLLSVVGMTKMYAYDFSAVCETGQTLYYNITDAVNHYVELTCPGMSSYNSSWSGFTEPAGDIILPESVQYEGNTYTVTSISAWAFYDCRGLTGSLTIPNTVVSIGTYAFYGCKNFTGSLVIPDGVTKIPQYAFAKCSGFNGLVIPSSVVSIRSHAFYGCNHLTQVSISGNTLTLIGLGAFAKCRRLTGHLVIPNSVTKIHDGAFSECSQLTGVTIGSSVTSIGQSAFYECSGLMEIEIPHSVTSIGDCAFMGCSGLTSITIPNSVTNLGFIETYECRIFADCPGLEQITVEQGNPVYDSRDNCNAIIVTASNQLLIGCKNTVIPASVTSIGGYAFYGSGLTSITIPNSVTSTGEQAFSFCTGLTTITIPGSVTSIGSAVLGNCSALTSVEILCSPTSIPSFMFLSCGNLTAFEIPESVTIIESFAFSNCTSLTSIEIPSSVTTIQMRAFNNCSGLTSMTVWADNPPALTPNTYNPYVFDNVDKSIPLHVPCGSIEAYRNASGWSVFTNIQEVCTQTQTITLSQGWNWFSANLEITLDDLKTSLTEALPSTSIKIKSQSNGSTSYNGSTWRGALNSLDVSQMYMISVNTDCEITLTGMPINPAEHPVTISNGVNWIAFPLGESMTLDEAFIGFAVSGDKVKSQTTTGNYNGSLWRPSFSLVPGKGYMFISNMQGTRIFTFPANAK